MYVLVILVVLIIPIRKSPSRGSRIPEPLPIFNSKCPVKAQISQGPGPLSHDELLKTGRTVSSHTLFPPLGDAVIRIMQETAQPRCVVD